jgi:hypothetical protein
MMTDEAIKAHFDEKHAGQPVPAKADVDAMIEANTMEMTMPEQPMAA